MSPRPNIEKWLEFWMLGNTSLPGNDSLGASLIKPDKWSFLANKPTGFSAGLVATFTITFALKMYEEKNTQKTSYTSSPTSSRVETLRLGSRTRAINATHSPIPRASMRSQCPVSTHIHTIIKDRKKDKISAAVNRPHTPNDILQSTKQHSLLSEQIKFVIGASLQKAQ